MDLRLVALIGFFVLVGCLAPQTSQPNVSGNPAGNNVQNVPAGNQTPGSQPANPPAVTDCSADNTKPTLSISYEVLGKDYLHLILNGKDSDGDSLVYALNVTDTSGNPVGKLSQNPDKSFTWTDNTEYVKNVNAIASVSDLRGSQVCNTVTQNQTIEAIVNITERNVTG